MDDLLEPLGSLFIWFNQTFDAQKEKSEYWNRAQRELEEHLGELHRRHRLTDDEIGDIRDKALDIEVATQELAYVRGINDGVRLIKTLQSDNLSEQIMAMMNDLIKTEKGVISNTKSNL